jgi:hypothetical protein
MRTETSFSCNSWGGGGHSYSRSWPKRSAQGHTFTAKIWSLQYNLKETDPYEQEQILSGDNKAYVLLHQGPNDFSHEHTRDSIILVVL